MISLNVCWSRVEVVQMEIPMWWLNLSLRLCTHIFIYELERARCCARWFLLPATIFSGDLLTRTFLPNESQIRHHLMNERVRSARAFDRLPTKAIPSGFHQSEINSTNCERNKIYDGKCSRRFRIILQIFYSNRSSAEFQRDSRKRCLLCCVRL